jgi:hypothetical protein
MKILPVCLITIWAILLTGCSSLNLPPNSCDSATVGLNVGPFFSQHATISGASKQSDGTILVGVWQGQTSYLGVVNFTQEFHNLRVQPNQTAPAVVSATPAAK